MSQTQSTDCRPATNSVVESLAGSVPSRSWSKLVFAAMLTLLLASGIVIATFFQFDGAMAMRAATQCVMPLGLTWHVTFFLAVFLLLVGKRTASLGFLAAWFVLSIVANGWVARAVIEPIEWPRDPNVLEDPMPFRCVVTLGGSITIANDGTAELNGEGQRVMLAAQLWYAGKTQSVICTGSSSDNVTDPSTACSTMLASIGIPKETLYEVKGRNTSEEMQSLKQFLLNPPDGFPREGRIGLITSAFHMRRAMRLAEQRGLDLVPLPCSHRIGKETKFSPATFVPDAGAAGTLAAACKEWLARLLGR